MTDLIRRQDAINVIEKWFKLIGLNQDICVDGLLSLPSAPMDAIPIEWLSNKAKEFEHSDNSILQDGAFLIKILIDYWKEEQEEQSDTAD